MCASASRSAWRCCLPLRTSLPARAINTPDEVAAADWDTMDGSQLLMRLLCAAPFSAHDVRPPLPMVARPRGAPQADAAGPMPLCTALGRLLDATVLPRHRARPYANIWLAWSHRLACDLAGVYTGASGSAARYMPCTACPPAAGAAAQPSTQVLSVRHGIKVSRVDAGAHVATMANAHPSGDLPVMNLV
jgi:hypothetical protein